MPTSSRELWQWVRTQPMLDTATRVSRYRERRPDAARGDGRRVSRDARCRASGWRTRRARWTDETNRLATRFAAFLGCEPDEVQFTRGAGEALGQAIAGLDLAAGDEVITTTREHPAALSPWLVLARRRDVVVKQIELPTPLTGPEQALGLFAGAVTERTKVLAFSHVQYDDGAVLPVKDLCAFARQRGILTVVDGAQALGMLEFAVRDLGCDFYATCCHKWLGGSHGTGALYVRREMLDRLWPVEPRGLDSVPPVFTPTDADGNTDVPAALHKLGNIVPYAWPALRGVEAALEFQQQVGRSKIEARIRELAIYARLRLQQLHGHRAADSGASGPVGRDSHFPCAGKIGDRPRHRSGTLASRARARSALAERCGRRAPPVAARLQHARRRRKTRPGSAASAALTWISRI